MAMTRQGLWTWGLLLLGLWGAQPCRGQYIGGDPVVVPPFVTTDDPPVLEPDLLLHPSFDNSWLSGAFIRFDPIFFIMTPPRETVIGDPNTTYTYDNDAGGVVTVSPSLDTSWITPNGDWGARFEFGRAFEQGGWQVGILNVEQEDTLSLNGALIVFADPQSLLAGYRDSDNDGIDDDRDNDNIYGASGQDTSTPPDGTIDAAAPSDPDDLVFFLPTFSRLDMTASTQLTGVEAQLFRRFGGAPQTSSLDYFLGARYLRLADDLHLTGYGGPLDTTIVDTHVNNHIVGPQVGARWSYRVARTTLALDVRGMAGYNRQHVQQAGTIASNHSGNDRPSTLYANSFSSARERNEFSPLTEWRTEILVEVLPGLNLRLGYTGMYLGGISRAAPKVRYQLPNMGLLDTDNNQRFYANGFNIGVEGIF